MIRTGIATTALIAGLFTSFDTAAHAAASAAQAAAQVTAADAAPFIGEWTLTLEGQNGPAAFDLAVKAEQDKVVGEITGPEGPAQPITDITKADKSLLLRYSFDYQGMAVSAVVSLAPQADGKMSAQIEFAGGAYIMTGTATKKEKAK